MWSFDNKFEQAHLVQLIVILLREDPRETWFVLRRFCLQGWMKSRCVAPALTSLSVSARLGPEALCSVRA